jgi:hypothetical protein
MHALFAERPNGIHSRFDERAWAYWEIEIANAGKAEVRDLVLQLPFEGEFVADKGEAANFTDKISLGSLRAKDKILIKIWPKYHSSIWDETKLHVTHAGGSVPVKVGHTVYGTAGEVAALLQNPRSRTILLFFISLFVAVIMTSIGCIRLMAVFGQGSSTASPPTTKPISAITSRN